MSTAHQIGLTSPIKGIERITEELRIERQRTNTLLQEKARIKNESESLKLSMEQQRVENQQLKEDCDNLKRQLEQLQTQNQSFSDAEERYLSHIQQKQHEIDEIKRLYDQCKNEYDNLIGKMEEQKAEINSLKLKSDSIDRNLSTKDDLIKSLKNELLEVRQVKMQLEQEKLTVYQQCLEQSDMNEALQTKLQLVDAVESGYQQTKLSNDELRIELENSMALNSSLNDQIHDLNNKLIEKVSMERDYQQKIAQLQQDCDELTTYIHDLELNRDDMISTIEAETCAREAALSKAETAVKNRSFLDNQLNDLKKLYESALEKNVMLEEENSLTKIKINALQEEVFSLQESIRNFELNQNSEISSSQAMTSEIETLRLQLQNMRKRLVQRDLEDEAGSLSPQAILDRELQGRQVYEGIISDLRAELDKLNVKYHQLVQKHDDLLLQSGRVEQLEAEVEMYKEMARNITAESQTMALTASEITERNLKSTHEKQNLLQELHNAEVELHSSKLESQRLREEINSLRDKLKQFHTNKLSSDKRATELLAVNAKLEASLEDFRQQYDLMTIDLDKAKRAIQEQNILLSEARAKQTEVEKLKADLEANLSQVTLNKQQLLQSNKKQQQDLDNMKHQQELLNQEISNLKAKYSSSLNLSNQLQSELSQLNLQNETLLQERDMVKRELAQLETQKAESQLNQLKREMEQTARDYEDYEKEKSIKDKMIQQLQLEMSKEKEKNVLFKMQISMLEERVKVLSQELSVYKSIDVYHSSMQIELQSYRNKEKLIDEGNFAGFSSLRNSSSLGYASRYTKNETDTNSNDLLGASRSIPTNLSSSVTQSISSPFRSKHMKSFSSSPRPSSIVSAFSQLEVPPPVPPQQGLFTSETPINDRFSLDEISSSDNNVNSELDHTHPPLPQEQYPTNNSPAINSKSKKSYLEEEDPKSPSSEDNYRETIRRQREARKEQREKQLRERIILVEKSRQTNKSSSFDLPPPPPLPNSTPKPTRSSSPNMTPPTSQSLSNSKWDSERARRLLSL